jgi:hypothetical protein
VTEPLPPEDPRDALIREQAALLKEQAEQIAALTALVAELREQLDAARRAVSRNSGNSSMPPSADDLPGRRLPARTQRRAAERAVQKRSRESSRGRRARRCAGAGRTRSFRTSRKAPARAGWTSRGAGGLGVFRPYQQQDVPEPQPSRRYQHDLHRARCTCGRVHAAPRPAGVPDAPLSTGPRLSALAVHLTVFQHVPVERAQLLIADLAGSAPPVGFVHSCLRKAAGLAAEPVRLIRALIAASPVAGFDETTLRSGPAGEKKNVHGAFTGLYSAFHLGTRSIETMKKGGILPSFAGIAATDRYAGYRSETWTALAGHQACAAHLLRDLQDCAESYPARG